MFNQVKTNNVTKKRYVGNCINSFDEDGDCVIPDLPFTDVSDLAYQLEDAIEIGPSEFHSKVSSNTDFDGTHVVYYKLPDESVYVLYDTENDVHFFFV